MPRNDDLAKALNLLIHDLRAPLGVALGYLRLLKEHRLPSADEQDRALAQSIESLGRITRLCRDASGYVSAVQSPAPAAEAAVPASEMVRRIGDAVQAIGLAWTTRSVPSGTLKVTRADIVASAVGAVLGSARRPGHAAGGPAAIAQADDHHLYLLAGTEAQQNDLMSGIRREVDPWRGGHGIELALACLHLSDVGGRVWTTDTARPGIGVALPLEVSTT